MARLCVSLGRQISREVKFPGKLNFPGSQISGKLDFPGSQISEKSNFLSDFLGSQIFREVKFSKNLDFMVNLDFLGKVTKPEMRTPGKYNFLGKFEFPEKF